VAGEIFGVASGPAREGVDHPAPMSIPGPGDRPADGIGVEIGPSPTTGQSWPDRSPTPRAGLRPGSLVILGVPKMIDIIKV